MLIIFILLGVSALAGFFCLHKVQDYIRGGQKFSQLDPNRKQMVIFTLVGEWPALFLGLYCIQQVILFTSH